MLVGSLDAWACDYVTTTMMGVYPQAIGFLAEPVRTAPYPVTRLTPDEFRVLPAKAGMLRFDFELPLGWRKARAGSAQRDVATDSALAT